jgi:hypothetical protein
MRYTIPPSRMVMRRQALDEALAAQPMPDDVWPDVFVTTAMGALGWGAVHVPEALVTCGWHAGQVSRSVGSHDMAIGTWRALRFDDPAIEDLRRASLARALVGRAAHHLARGDRSAGAADLAEAATSSPTAWRRERRVLAAAARLGAIGRVGVAAVIARRDRRRRPAVQT